MKKILYITNISRGVGSFSNSCINVCKKKNLDFWYCSNFSSLTKEEMNRQEIKYGIHLVSIPFNRKPTSFDNIKAILLLYQLCKKEKFDIIHCNTPIGGVAGRIVGSICNIHPIIYQVHGFHFYKGAPKWNWITYFPVELLLSKLTDYLITINSEDYQLAKLFHMKNGNPYFVHGVGIDLDLFCSTSKNDTTISDLKIPKSNKIVISTGDLIDRKNYEISLKAISQLDPDIHFIICGSGPKEKDLKELSSQLGINDRVHFLGFRSDIIDLLNCSDIYLFASKQEGLPRGVMEAMAAGLAVVASDIRGNDDLIVDNKGGFLVPLSEPSEFANKLKVLLENDSLRTTFGEYNKNRILKYSILNAENELFNCYTQFGI